MKKTILLSYDYFKDSSDYGGIILGDLDSTVLSELLTENDEAECSEQLVNSFIESGSMTGNTLLYLAAIGLETITLQNQMTSLDGELEKISSSDMTKLIEIFNNENE